METINIHFQGIQAGIYLIYNQVNGKFYLGSTNCFYKRKSAHKRLLEKNDHHSLKLQRAFNKYKIENFCFIVIDGFVEISEEELLKVEQWYLDIWKPHYNINKIAGKPAKMTHEEYSRYSSRDWTVTDPSGNIIKVTNLKKFCQERNLDYCAMMKIARKEAISYKEWRCFYPDDIIVPFNDIKDSYRKDGSRGKRKYKLTFLDGTSIKIHGLNDWCKENNLWPAIHEKIVDGIKYRYIGPFRKRILIEKIDKNKTDYEKLRREYIDKKPQSHYNELYIITYPDGIEIKINNLYHFCKHHAIERRNMVSCISGKRNHHKQYKCRKCENN